MNTPFFEPIQLNQMDKVKLMRRIDRKFWFHRSSLGEILHTIKEYYYLLSIEGRSRLPYVTTYYDTSDNRMYNAHHNGKLNRIKIRKRRYVVSNISFLEIKIKSNKGKTTKKRIPSINNRLSLSPEEDRFIRLHTPFTARELAPSLHNQYRRLTLVKKDFQERCTIDLNLQYKMHNKRVEYPDLAIVEIKSQRNSRASPFGLALKNQRIKSAGLSKYCVGRTVTDSSIKQNAFKEKIRSIEKTIRSANVSHLYN